MEWSMPEEDMDGYDLEGFRRRIVISKQARSIYFLISPLGNYNGSVLA
jgi:hypothetical protein